MFKSANIKLIVDYSLVSGLIAVSAFPYFCTAQINFFFLFLFAFFIYIKRSIRFDERMLLIVGAFVVVEVLQFLIVKPFDPKMISGTFIRMFLSFFIVCITGKKFTEYFTDILYVISIIGFVFFIPSIIFPSFFNFCVSNICTFFDPPFVESGGFYETWPTIIIYCFHDCILEEFRNPGAFWEPGLYSVFINLALIFNLIKEKKIMGKKNIVLILALISTFSTAGYIAFFLLVFSFYIINQSFIRKIILSAIIIPTALSLYFSLDFLSRKVEENIDLAGTTTSSRFGSALADYTDFLGSPYIGWGRGVMRYGGKSFAFFSEDQHRNNSVTDLLATYGIFIFLLYFYCYYSSLKKICINYKFKTQFAILALMVILTLGFSQSIFLKPFFYSMLFLQYTYDTKSYKNITEL